MTITIAWVRSNKETSELILASDSRLRSRGALDQAQKIFRLERGDCCLGFCGDAQVAYPLFIQVGTALNSFIKTRSRAEDAAALKDNVKRILNNLVDSWDLPKKEKAEDLAHTKILFCGWSWKNGRYFITVYKYKNGEFDYHNIRTRLPHPWHEEKRSLVFIGDYQDQYMGELAKILRSNAGKANNVNGKKVVPFDYEPAEALNAMLKKSKTDPELFLIGGAPQMVKMYKFSNSLPYVVRVDNKSHHLFGRKLFDWEKTEYPIINLDVTPPRIAYPLAEIPLPSEI